MVKQKFKRGDVVHIAAELGQSMSHFENDKDAVILGSYADQFGGDCTSDYTVKFLDDGSECSWYEEHQLTFLYHGGEEFIVKITKETEEREKVESDLGWIVDNWKRIREDVIPAATSKKLMSLIGITNPWGNRGEGIDYYNHFKYTVKCLDSVLLTGDIKKVKKFVEEFPKVNEFIFSSDVYNGKHELRRPSFVP
jgi:hypothetical protein